MYGFYGFHGRGTDFFLTPNALFRAKNKKNPYRIREIRKIRTSIRIAMYPKV
jgi:hypothetical protein